MPIQERTAHPPREDKVAALRDSQQVGKRLQRTKCREASRFWLKGPGCCPCGRPSIHCRMMTVTRCNAMPASNTTHPHPPSHPLTPHLHPLTHSPQSL